MNKNAKLARLGHDQLENRDLFLLELSSVEDFPERLEIRGSHYVALIVWNANQTSDGVIKRFAKRLIESGSVYCCAWGDDCERVHDMIDSVWVDGYFDEASVDTLMTTWHTHASLTDTIWFAINTAIPTDGYVEECRSVVAICIDFEKKLSDIRDAFEDPAAFNDAVFSNEDKLVD